MSEQTPINNPQSEPIDQHDDSHDLFGRSSGSSWIAGLILILLGGYFLLQNLGRFTFPLHNWWALFILIPALGSFEAAYRSYRNSGNLLDTRTRRSLISGLILTFITASFLFDFEWSYFGPVLIILVGIGVLATTMLTGKK